MGWSYFGAGTPSASRPTPRPTLCVGVGGGKETREGHDCAPLTPEAGWGRSQPTWTKASGAILSSQQGTLAVGVVVKQGSRLIEVSTLDFKGWDPPPSPLLPSRRLGWEKGCIRQA